MFRAVSRLTISRGILPSMTGSDLLDTLLRKRGIERTEDVSAFLSPDYELHTHSPFLLQGMEEAIERALLAIERNERIAIYADFDCDGIPGAALLSDAFSKLKYEHVDVYLPHRDREGYGFHTEAIEQLAGRGVTLVITVDVGTTAIEAVRFAKEWGVDVIVTDHHEIPGALPDAVAVLNPKRNLYPFPHLCGAAVAYKFVQGLLTRGKERGIARFTAIGDGWEKWLLDLVAIATVADMVPLIGENRVLAHWGLTVLRKSPRPGLIALFTRLRLRKNELTEDDIGFSIAPRINAASRMDDPDLALRLLTTKDSHEAESLAGQLEKLNASRKGVVSGMVREARRRVRERFQPGEVAVLGDPDWKPALLGLAANSVMEDRGGVVCLWGRDSKGKIKGSCRSDGTLSVVDLFGRAGDVFEECGGHAASGGFTVRDGAVHSLPETLSQAAKALERKQTEEVKEHDALIALREVALPLYRDISRLAPFGIGNPKPIFRLSRVRVTEVRRFGKENNHVEITLSCIDTSSAARAFDFFRGPENFTQVPERGVEASVLATIERDAFRGGLALRLVDVLPA